MGRIGGWFKKDKEKATSASISNPYAQEPVEQQAPPPQYDPYTQHNAQQYNENRYISAQAPPSGLPAGPRPGGLPSRVAPGPPRTGTVDSGISGIEKTPPPQYAPPGAQLPPYPSGSPSLSSVGGTPVLPSNTSSPSVGGGFPSEKHGALDGFGKARFESPAQSPHQNSTSFPSQHQGGYGNLDSRNELFANYNGPSKPTTRSSPTLADAPYGSSMQDGESRPMTEEEWEDAEVAGITAQIVEEGAAANDVGRRNIDKLAMANAQMRAMNSQLRQNQELLDRAEKNMDKTRCEAEVSGVNLDDLDAANAHMLNLAANSKKRIAQRAEKKMAIHQRYQMMGDQEEGDDLEWKLEAARRKLEAAEPKGLLGATSRKSDHSRFEFEDDSGQQRENNEEHDRIVEILGQQARELRLNVEEQTVMLEHQNSQIDRMTEKTMAADDRVTKNRFRLDNAKYNKR